MLDLDAAVQLEEEEGVVLDDELDGAGAAVSDRPSEGDGGLVQAGAEPCIEVRSRSFLEDLLVASLDRAVALAERDDAAVRVGEELHLDMPWTLEVPLAVERPVGERAGGLALCRGQRFVELRRRADDTHPAPAASGGRLDEKREPDLLRRAVREHRHSRVASDPLRRDLVPAEPQRVGRRSDPREPRRLDGLREVGVLREEPVARMDRVGAGLARGTDVLLGAEVARDLDGRIRRASVQRGGVVRRGDRDRLDPERAARAEHAQRDLSSVRDEQPLDRHGGTLCRRRYRLVAVIRLLVRMLIAFVSNAVGLIVAAAVLDGMSLDVTGFLVAVAVFTIVFALLQPFLFSVFRRSPGPVLGGVALIATLVSLIATDLLTDGLSIRGVGTWIAATVIVWLGSVLAAFILPFLGLKKYLDDRRA